MLPFDWPETAESLLHQIVENTTLSRDIVLAAAERLAKLDASETLRCAHIAEATQYLMTQERPINHADQPRRDLALYGLYGTEAGS